MKFHSHSTTFTSPIIIFFVKYDITNIPFLRKIASKEKPVLLSTGASNLNEIDTAVFELKNANQNIKGRVR